MVMFKCPQRGRVITTGIEITARAFNGSRTERDQSEKTR
ncbi:hypothetical protein V1293_004118 [Bradyrhizobium sp. AZCC 1693]